MSVIATGIKYGIGFTLGSTLITLAVAPLVAKGCMHMLTNLLDKE